MSAGDPSLEPPAEWPGADGAPLSCREKLKVLAENHREAAQVLRDAFEDAVLMGVDEVRRRMLAGEGLDTAAVCAHIAPLRAELEARIMGDDMGALREAELLRPNAAGPQARFLSLREHLEVITDAREYCESFYEQDPNNAGMGLLAAQFVETDRVEYLDKS